MSKSAFVRSLQREIIALSPYHVSQRLRQAHGWVSVYLSDPGLAADLARAYMVRLDDDGKQGTPEDPVLYQCVVSLAQSPAWQSLAWIKEIIHILDRAEHRTNTPELLGQLLDSRHPKANGDPVPSNVKADHDGFTLALGCAIPQGYRQILRAGKYHERFSAAQLEDILLVPQEYIPTLFDPQFEGDFEAAIIACDKT